MVSFPYGSEAIAGECYSDHVTARKSAAADPSTTPSLGDRRMLSPFRALRSLTMARIGPRSPHSGSHRTEIRTGGQRTAHRCPPSSGRATGLLVFLVWAA